MSALRNLLLASLVLWPALVSAQPAPIVASTVRTTNTTTTSIRVGCTSGGTCTGGITAGPIDVSQVTSSGFIGIANNVPGVTTFRLYNNAGTLTWNGVALATGASLSGTLNTIPVFTGTNSVGNSIITQNAGATIITVTGSLAATLSTASQPNITGLGTITSGTWGSAATKIGLASGGTNADLSGTGGTSQFLRQNSVGATVTVVRPAISDLSDGTNVALLNAANTFTAFGAHTWTSGGVTGNTINLVNTTAGTGAFARINIGNDVDGALGRIQVSSSTFTGAGPLQPNVLSITSDGGLNIGTNAGLTLGFYSNNLQRWGINAAGDLTFGASNIIAMPSSTPTISSGFGGAATISGSASAFTVSTSASANTGGTINLNRTASTGQWICNANIDLPAAAAGLIVQPSGGTSVTIGYPSFATVQNIYIQCMGR